MANKLANEVEYLSKWLPSKLGEEETRRLVAAAVDELAVAGDEKAAGRVTGHLMKSHGKDLDGALVSRVSERSWPAVEAARLRAHAGDEVAGAV
ncbi:MAG: GatB/YqeY domain-containing protein, partial [Acidimicrobiia bacterium]